MEYDLPDVIRVEADGPVRIVRLSRPEQLNAINDELHLGLTRAVPAAQRRRRRARRGDHRRRPRVLGRRRLRPPRPHGEGPRAAARRDRRRPRARAQHDPVPRPGRRRGQRPGGRPRLQRRSRSPTSCTWRSRRTSSDPHVTVGLVAADGGPLTWPLHTSLLLAKEYAFTGDRISAAARGRDRPRQPRVPRRRGARRRARGRAQDRRAAAAGGRGDEAGAEPARRARRARDDRLRDGVPRPSRSTRPSCARTSTASCNRERRDRHHHPAPRARDVPRRAARLARRAPRRARAAVRAAGHARRAHRADAAGEVRSCSTRAGCGGAGPSASAASAARRCCAPSSARRSRRATSPIPGSSR